MHIWSALACHGRLVLTLIAVTLAIASADAQMKVEEGTMISCPPPGTERVKARTKRLPAKSFLEAGVATAQFKITFGPEALASPAFQEAVRAAADIWSREIVSSVPIRMRADYVDFGNGNALASAGPSYFVTDFPGAPRTDVSYPAALANAIAGQRLDPSRESDLRIRVNNQYPFYFGTDGQPGNNYDLISVVLHEMGHGLGFTAQATYNEEANFFRAGRSIFSRFIVDGEGVPLLDFPENSRALADALTSNDLYVNGFHATRAATGSLPRLYAPPTFDPGSSVSHWDERAYPPGNLNSLMSPQFQPGEVIFNVGNITRGHFQDMGWSLNPSSIYAFRADAREVDEVLAVNGADSILEVVLYNDSDLPMDLGIAYEGNQLVTLGEPTLRIPANDSARVFLQVDISETGVAAGLIRVENGGTPILDLPVLVQVVDGTEVPGMVVEEPNLTDFVFPTREGSIQNSKSFTVKNTGTAELRFTYSLDDGGLAFLSASSPRTQVISVGGSDVRVPLRFDATNLSPGDYPFSITITSNDPANPRVLIEGVFPVLGKPVLRIEPAAPVVTFQMTDGPDYTRRVRIQVINTGEDNVTFNRFRPSVPYIHSFPSFRLIAGNSSAQIEFTVDASSLETGEYETNIELVESGLFASNPITLNLPVRITVNKNPLLGISTEAVEAFLNVRDERSFITTETITLTNPSDTLVPFRVRTVSGNSRLRAFPREGTLEPGERQDIDLQFDAVLFTEDGTVTDTLVINETQRIPTTFTVENQVGLFAAPTFDIPEPQVMVGETGFGPDFFTENSGPGSISIDRVYLQKGDASAFTIFEWYIDRGEEDRTATGTVGVRDIFGAFIDFTPTRPGLYRDTLIVESPDVFEPYRVPLEALGGIPAPEFQPERDTVLASACQEVELRAAYKNVTEFPLSFVTTITSEALPGLVVVLDTLALEGMGRQDFTAILPTADIPPGDYQLTITTDFRSTEFAVRRIEQSVLHLTVRRPQVSSLQLTASDGLNLLGTLRDGDTLDLNDLPSFKIRADATDLPDVGSVVFRLNGGERTHVDNAAPYLLERVVLPAFDFAVPFQLPLGTNTLTVIPYCGPDGSGQAGDSLTVTFFVEDGAAPAVEEVLLLDNRGRELQPLRDGDVLFVDDPESESFNFRALLNDVPAYYVSFTLDDGVPRRAYRDPYTFIRLPLFRSLSRGATLAEGTHSLTVVPYGRNYRGSFGAGNPQVISFEVRRNSAARDLAKQLQPDVEEASPEAYPNPVSGSTLVAVKGIRRYALTLLNSLGQEISLEGRWVDRNEESGNLNMEGLDKGAYYLILHDAETGRVQQLGLIKQ